jgi:hypothetical protein
MAGFRVGILRELFTHKKYRQDRWSSDEEVLILCNYIQAYGLKTVFEIGTGYGFSAACMQNAGAKVYTFDTEDHHKIYNDEKFPKSNKYMRWTKDDIVFKAVGSPECFQYICLPPTSVLFYIDGHHGRGAMMETSQLVRAITREGDVAVFRGVVAEAPASRFWVNFREQNPMTTETSKTESGLGVYRP